MNSTAGAQLGSGLFVLHILSHYEKDSFPRQARDTRVRNKRLKRTVFVQAAADAVDEQVNGRYKLL